MELYCIAGISSFLHLYMHPTHARVLTGRGRVPADYEHTTGHTLILRWANEGLISDIF
jgi:hypothetical protein